MKKEIFLAIAFAFSFLGEKNLEKQLAGIRLGKNAAEVIKIYDSPTYLLLPSERFLKYMQKEEKKEKEEIVTKQLGEGIIARSDFRIPGIEIGKEKKEKKMGERLEELPISSWLFEDSLRMKETGYFIYPDIDHYLVYENPRAKNVKYEKGNILEFGIDKEGNVASICIAGKKYNGARTSRNIALGDDLKKVVLNYGYPERTAKLLGKYEYDFFAYPKTSNITFAFEKGKVVGIFIREESKIVK